MFEFIEKVVYINLEHRKDRKEETEAELLKYFPAEKIVRFNGIYDKNVGSFGCSKSHNGAMELAIENKWKNVLIVEDDASWDPRFDTQYPILEELVKNPYDVICLGVLGHSDTKTHKLRDGQTRTAYLVGQHYYQTFLDHQKEGLEKFMNNPLTLENRYKYCGDQYWKILQKRDNWFRVRLMYQRKSYSDIQKYTTNYEKMFLNN
jgi:glycosyl transferase family 25